MFFDNCTIELPRKTHRMGEFMKHFILKRSDDEFYTSTSGIALVGHALNRFTKLTSSVAKAVPLSHGISHAT